MRTPIHISFKILSPQSLSDIDIVTNKKEHLDKTIVPKLSNHTSLTTEVIDEHHVDTPKHRT